MFPVDATGALQLARLPRGLSNKLRGLGAALYGNGLVAQHAGEVLDNPDDAAAVGAVPVRQRFIDTNSWDCKLLVA